MNLPLLSAFVSVTKPGAGAQGSLHVPKQPVIPPSGPKGGGLTDTAKSGLAALARCFNIFFTFSISSRFSLTMDRRIQKDKSKRGKKRERKQVSKQASKKERTKE